MRGLSAPLARSLSLRLLAFAGVAVGLALAAAWAVLGLLFERHLERQLQTELERHGVSLIAALELDEQGRPVLGRQPVDPRFDRPASGLYWRIVAPDQELRSRSLWDGQLPPLPQAGGDGWAAADVPGAFEARIIAVGRRVRPDADGPEVLVEVAADRSPVSAARADFGRESAIFLAILWAALAAAAWLQVRLGLRPLNRVRAELLKMADATSFRMAAEEHPAEIQPLTAAINQFADRRAEDVERARHRAKDLAHALKTPITALRLQAEALGGQRAQEMSQSIALLTGAVDGELARTDSERSSGEIAVSAAIDRLFAVIARTPSGSRLTFHNRLDPAFILPMSAERAMEALGALLENAARHARTNVVVTGSDNSQTTGIEICDDGPGIPEAMRPVVLDRGVRLDERSAGHGLGLSIAQDIVEASGGTLVLGEAPGGGLCVRLSWLRT